MNKLTDTYTLNNGVKIPVIGLELGNLKMVKKHTKQLRLP